MNNSISSKGLLYPNPCPHCGKDNTKKACYEFCGQQNGRKYGVCFRGASPATGWEQALTREGNPRTDKDGNLVYQEIIPYKQNGSRKSNDKKLEATYYYPSKEGKPLIKIDCYRDNKGEKYPYASRYIPNSDTKWVSGYKDHIRREDIPIYRYQDIKNWAISKGEPIWIVEGEKCAECLWNKMGLAATTNIGGAGKTGNKWKPSDTACLDGAKEIILCPDQDKPGILHMEAIYKQLLEYGFPKSSIKWAYCYPNSEKWENIPEAHGLDVYDWINDGATYQDILDSVREEKKAIAFSSPEIEFSNSSQNQSAFNISISDSEFKQKKDTLHFLFHTEDGKKKAVNDKMLTDAINILYKEKLRYNLLDFEPYLKNKLFKDVEGELEHLYLKLSYLYNIEIPKQQCIDTVLALSMQRKFDPVQDYLKKCNETVEPISIDNLATRYLDIDTELANKYLELWILGAAARRFYPGCDMRHLLVLQSRKEQIGKTAFFNILGGEFFSDSLGSSKGKDELLLLRKAWIFEYGEIETMLAGKEVGEIKRFLSGKEDSYRKPYGKSVETHKRMCIFCGTCNETEFLKDPGGNTRFWIIPVEKINLELLERERDAIWSMATKLILEASPKDVMRGKLWHLPEHLKEANTENTRQYVVRNEWEAIVQGVIDEKGHYGMIPPCEIWKALEIDGTQDKNRLGSKLSKTMTKLGWKRSKQRRTNLEIAEKKQVFYWLENSISEDDADIIHRNTYKR